MELAKDGLNGGATAQGTEEAEGARQVIPSPDAVAATSIPADLSTAALRRCTALATRARADLLTPGRQDSAAQLAALLEEMGSWKASRLIDPDPTMVVLAAAALQDLADRLPVPAPAGLEVRIELVLAVLHAVMERGRVAAPA
ncbi:hypothetical protein ACIGH6_08960 [Brachybacterium paraconglomeratum]|uniref:hypothetical protein n=1 Tax=Brachybacterium TaxID=43668 RepID=UPI003241D30B